MSIRTSSTRFYTKAFALAVIYFYLSSLTTYQTRAAAGDLDLTFGNSGKVTVDFFGQFDEINSIAIQPDGKIVAAGAASGITTSGNFALARFNANGSLDPTFGTGGKVVTDFLGFGFGDGALDVAIQPDGKIVAAGSTVSNRGSDFALVRYNSNGSIDTSFGTGGKVNTDFFGFFDFATAIVLQTDGKIVAVGSAGIQFASAGRPDFALARYNSDGSLDLSFGTGGKVTTDFLGLGDRASAVVIQPNGKIIAIGSNEVTPLALIVTDFALARYNSDGSLDPSFGTGGKVTTDLFNQFDSAHDAVLQPDGKIIVVGGGVVPLSNRQIDFALARYNDDGSLDSTFGSNGKVLTDFVSGSDEAKAVKLQPDGKIVVVGHSEDSDENSDFALARYNSNGSLDPGFGTGGKVKTEFFGFDDFAVAMAIQADGKIIAAGRANLSFEQADFTLARYDGDGPVFDICLQDDSSGNILKIDSAGGAYQFSNCNGLTVSGTGSLLKRSSIIQLQVNGPDRRVLATVDTAVKKGTASIQIFSQATSFTVMDRNTANNTCVCP